MAKRIKLPGRAESAEVGGIVAGAYDIMDDVKGKRQSVINQETDQELQRLQDGKQDNITVDSVPVEGSGNPISSGAVYTADEALRMAIEAILLLIPSAASGLNKLADRNYVQDVVSTSTATFRGTYNVVTNLHLPYDASHAQIEAALDALSLGADNNDFCYVQVPVSDQSLEIEKTERYKFNGTSWAYEYDLNNSGFTSEQWAAINSNITAALVAKLMGLPTSEVLATLLAGKQDSLTFDAVPMAGSNNPVKSGGVYQRNSEIVSLINALDVAKQDVLTFDQTPVNGSENPVTSGGVYQAIYLVQSALAALDGRVASTEYSVGLLTERVGILNTLYQALSQSDIIVGTLPASGVANVIYRVPGTSTYADWMWYGGAWVKLAEYTTLDGYLYKGIATPSGSPVASAVKMFYFAVTAGTYTNFGGLVVTEGISILKYDGANWTKEQLSYSDGIFDVTAYSGRSFASLDALLSAADINNLIPAAVRKPGMSIKFEDSSDNKYVQYRLTKDTWSTTVSDWQGIDDIVDNLNYINNIVRFKVGSLNSETGAEVVANTRARTAFIKSPFILELNEGYKIQMICKYQQNPDGTTTFIDLSGVRSNLSKYFGTSEDGYVYRLTVSKDTPSDVISDSDLDYIVKTFNSEPVFEDTNNLLGLVGKKVSVCGGSNWTFQGVSTGVSSRYYPGSSIVNSVDNTLWGMLIKKSGAVLEENVSVGSSGVTDNEYYHQDCYRKRVANGGLGSPDVVLLSGGMNEPPIGDGEGQMQIGTFDPTKATENLNLYEFCDAYDNLIRLINSECNNPRIIIYIHAKTDYRIASVMTGIGRYYGADIINSLPLLDSFEFIQNEGFAPIHYTQHDMTLVYNLIVGTLLQKTDGVTTNAVWQKRNVVKELYIDGLDITKHYHFRRLLYNTDISVFFMEIVDEYGNSLFADIFNPANGIVEFTTTDNHKGYVLFDMNTSDTLMNQVLINAKEASSLDENPSIHAFLIENGIIPDIRDSKADKGGITWINRVNISRSGLLRNYNSDAMFTSGLLLIDKSEDIKVKNGWYNKNDYIVPLYFYDENGIAISGYLDDLSDPTPGRKTFTIQKENIPANAKYIRVCSNRGPISGYADVLSGISLYSVANEVLKISRKQTKRESTNECELYGEETFNEHYYINSTSGAITGSNNYIATPFLNIKGAASLEVALFFNSVASNNNGLGFYDKDKNFISGVANHDTVPYAVLTINVPQNAEYIAVCMPTENNSLYNYNTSVNGVPCYIKVNYRYVEKRGFTEGNFDTQGSYTTPSSPYNNNTGQINISEGEVLEYRVMSNYNEERALIFDENDNIILQGTNLVSRGIIHETLVAPAGASYAIVYTRNTSWALTPGNFIPLAKIYRKRYGRDIDIDAFDEAIAEMRKGTPSEAQEQKIDEMVFGNNADFENASVIDYNPPVVASVSSDDALEGYIQHTPGSVVSQGGFFSRLYPVCETVGQIPSCEAVEYQRVVNDIEIGDINNSGKAMRALCAAKGWEAMNHTMTARFTAAYAFDTFADAMTAVSNHTINPVGEGVKSNGTTHIYIRDRKANYYYTKAAGTYSTDVSDWLIVPYQYIKPKLWNTSGVYISLNPTYPYDYQTRVAQKRIGEVLDTSVETYVAASDSNSYKLRKYALTTHKQSVYNATGSDIDFTYKNGIVKMPLVSNIARIGGYDLGEDSRIVVANNTEYNAWKNRFDELVRRGTKAFINAFHIYRYCWENRVPDDADIPTAAKVETVSGGTYPESWILPVRKPQDFPDDFLPPHPNTGLAKWGTFTMQDDGSIVDEAGVKVMDENGDFVQYSTTCWMPCYGTRLFQFWRFLLYIRSTGVEFMTIRDNVARLYNRLSVGSFPYAYNNAAFKVSDEPADMSYYFIGADGSKLYHKATL